MAAFDFKKEYKDLYQPKKTPSIVDVPEMLFIMVDGKGDPNTSAQYASAIEILYGLSYTIRFSKGWAGSFAYVVPPLEGLWALDDGGAFIGGGPIPDKNKFVWTSMIRQPEFVSQEVFEAAKVSLSKKKPGLDLSLARLETCAEGLCVQALHIGPYDDEPATVAAMDRFAEQSHCAVDISQKRRHHEIYLSDYRRTPPEKLRTILRHPIRAAG